MTAVITVVRWMYTNQYKCGNIVKLLNAMVDFQKLSTESGKT
jgi:hypothetical protein